MFDPTMIFASFLHALALMGLLAGACWRWGLPWREWPALILLLLWGSLVLAGYGAGLLNGLNQLSVYVPTTFVGVGVMLAIFHSLWRLPALAPLVKKPELSFAEIESAQVKKGLFWFLAITLGLFALVSIVIGMSVYPDNADSMIYRLPRAIWYVSHGNFLHPFDSLDNRLVYYPLDGVMLYVPLVLYGLPGTFHSLPSLLSWGIILCATYRFSRELGADRVLSLFAAWLVGMTPSILAQATSTNDEILSAAVLLCGFYMGWRWLVTGRRFYFFMAGLAIGLSAGTKLHIVFLLPIIGIGMLIVAWNVRQNPSLLRRWGHAIGWKTGLTTLLIIAVMFAPFLFYNYVSVGRFYFLSDFKDDVFNLSASLRVTFQNLLIYFSQMTLSPIADMNFWPVANDRQHFNTALNQIFNPLIAPLLDNDPTHYHLMYRFVGVTIPVSVRFVEFSLWSGFVWMLWPLQARLVLTQNHPLRPLFFLLAITPPFWLLFWSISTLYMEGTATYFSFYLICAAPAAVLAFLPISRPLWNEVRWVVIAIVTLSSLIIGHNLVMYSGFRSLPDLYYSRAWPYDWLLTEPRIIKEVQSASRVRVLFTHEKMPYFGYMHWNPSATYYTPFKLKKQDEIPDIQNVLQILPISSLHVYGFMPIKVPDKVVPGVTYLGVVRAIGREAIFAVGNGVEKRYPEDSNYILLQAQSVQTAPRQWGLDIASNPMGFSPEDHLMFEYDVQINGRSVYHRVADKNPGTRLVLPFDPNESPLTITTIVTSAWSDKEITRATYVVGGMGMWLPEGNEY